MIHEMAVERPETIDSKDDEEISMKGTNSRNKQRYPIVLLVCDSSPFSIVRYIERGLFEVSNLIVVHLDIQEWLLKKYGLPRLFYKLFRHRLSHLPVLPRDPDLILVVEPPVKTDLNLGKFADSVKAFYGLDPHGYYAKGAYKRCKVWEYDHVFSGQRDYVPLIKEMGCGKVHWLPYGVDPAVFREIKNVHIKYDVAFIGTLSADRKQALALLEKRFNTLVAGVGKGAYFMHDNSIAYSMSKIILEISRRGGLAARPFEGMACNRLVVANKVDNGLDRLFKDGKDIVLYRDLRELEEKVAYYLANENERKRIALQGYRLVTSKHTYKHRAAEVLRTTLGRTRTRFLDN